MTTAPTVVSLLCLSTASTLALAQATYQTIPDLGDRITGVSGDGNVIIARNGNQSRVWDTTNGIRAIPQLPGHFQTAAHGLSSDGRYTSIQNVRDALPRRQTSRFDLQSFTHETSGYFNDGGTLRSVEGFGISPDGGTIPVSIVTPSVARLSKWMPGSPIAAPSSHAPYQLNFPTDASTNGIVTVGNFFDAVPSLQGYESRNGVVSLLTPLAPNFGTRAEAVSHDGTIIVGSSGLVGAEFPVAWVHANGVSSPIALPAILGATQTIATSMSADGSVIGGEATMIGGTTQAWFWTQSTGSVLLRDFLAIQGISVTGLRNLTGISDDRRTLVGSVSGTTAFRIQLDQAFPAAPIPTPAGVGLLGLAGLVIARRRRA